MRCRFHVKYGGDLPYTTADLKLIWKVSGIYPAWWRSSPSGEDEPEPTVNDREEET